LKIPEKIVAPTPPPSGSHATPPSGADATLLLQSSITSKIIKRESAKKPAPLPLSVDNFKNEKTIELCSRKGLDIDGELKKFNNYFKGKTVFVDRFISWLERANPVSKDSRPAPKEWNKSEKKITRAMPPAELTGLIKSIRRKSMVQQ
jgi:hypothetical protein